MPKYPTIPELKRRGTIPLIGGAGAAAPFSPPDISGLQAWYKDTGIVNDGSNVTSWTDASGNGRTLTPVSTQPGYADLILNGISGVSFQTSDGDTGSPLRRGAAILAGTAATIFVVGYKDNTWNESGIWIASTAFTGHHPFSDLVIYDGSFSTARKTCGAQVVDCRDNWRIYCVRSQDNDWRMKIDGQSQFTTGTSTFATGSDFVLGLGSFLSSTEDYALLGYVMEVIVYNSFLSDSQEDQVGGYLAERFALTWTP